jgi:hypothetical protein
MVFSVTNLKARWMTALCITALAVVPTAFAQKSEAAPVCKPAPALLEMVRDPLLTRAIHKRIQARKPGLAPDGASTLSQEWLAGTRKSWFIENQRGGGDMIAAGVVLKDHALVDQGLREFEWGFKRQSKTDGGFPESGDAFHSVSVFLMDVERSLIEIKEAQPEFKDMMPRVNVMVPQVEAAALWLLRPEVLGPGRDHDSPFTHRRWILAGVLGDAAQLTGNRKLADAAVEFARAGLAMQKEDGENPERGGFDVSYQMVDGLQGARYYTSLRCEKDAALMAEVRRMIEKTCQWEMKRMLPDGSIDVTGSTRMLKETGRGGEIKHTNYPEIIQTYVFASKITGDPQYYEVAQKLAASQGW